MSLVRLLGFNTLSCGCLVGRYREVATSREVVYVEEKGRLCETHQHRRNHTVTTVRSHSGPETQDTPGTVGTLGALAATLAAAKAS